MAMPKDNIVLLQIVKYKLILVCLFFVWNLDAWSLLLNLITIHHVQIVLMCCVWLNTGHTFFESMFYELIFLPPLFTYPYSSVFFFACGYGSFVNICTHSCSLFPVQMHLVVDAKVMASISLIYPNQNTMSVDWF